jgi:hypothetical protein
MRYSRAEVRHLRNTAEDAMGTAVMQLDPQVLRDLCDQLLECVESEVEVGDDDDGAE